MNNWNLKVKTVSFMLVHKRVILIYEQDSYEKNYRTLMKEIKKDLIKKQIFHVNGKEYSVLLRCFFFPT